MENLHNSSNPLSPRSIAEDIAPPVSSSNNQSAISADGAAQASKVGADRNTGAVLER